MHTPERQDQQTYTLNEVMPVLAQSSGETITL